MPLPAPEPGLVINYEFLWSQESARAQTHGTKRRPAVIVLAIKTDPKKQPRVVVAPITHSQPTKDDVAIELPEKVRRHLGLDDEKQWVILNELNEFQWPGYDIYPVPDRPPGTFEYGLVPPLLHKQITEGILKLNANKRKRTSR